MIRYAAVPEREAADMVFVAIATMAATIVVVRL